MQNFRKIEWIVIENFPDAPTDGRTDARTRVNSKVPIPTKVGGPTSPKLSGPPKCIIKFKKLVKNLSLKIISPTFHHHPGLALKRLKGCDTYCKWTNGAFSGVKTFKFEFSTMENH